MPSRKDHRQGYGVYAGIGVAAALYLCTHNFWFTTAAALTGAILFENLFRHYEEWIDRCVDTFFDAAKK